MIYRINTPVSAATGLMDRLQKSIESVAVEANRLGIEHLKIQEVSVAVNFGDIEVLIKASPVLVDPTGAMVRSEDAARLEEIARNVYPVLSTNDVASDMADDLKEIAVRIRSRK